MVKAEIKEDKLHITSEYYDIYKGRYTDTTIVPVEDVERIEAKVGPRGGMHVWSVIGYNPKYSKDKSDRSVQVYNGDRKDSELIEQIVKLLPKIKYDEKTENGGAPW